MKRFLLISLFVLFVSCGGGVSEKCDCGDVEDYGWAYEGGEELYLLDIRNTCSGIIENDVQVTYNDFSTYRYGSTFCGYQDRRLN